MKPINPFTQPRRASTAIDLQRKAVKARQPKPGQYINIYPQADAIKRQRIARASI